MYCPREIRDKFALALLITDTCPAEYSASIDYEKVPLTTPKRIIENSKNHACRLFLPKCFENKYLVGLEITDESEVEESLATVAKEHIVLQKERTASKYGTNGCRIYLSGEGLRAGTKVLSVSTSAGKEIVFKWPRAIARSTSTPYLSLPGELLGQTITAVVVVACNAC